MVQFHASSVGNLLVGGNAITNKQRERLRELEARKADPEAKDLTEKMEQELADLRQKAEGEFKFGKTALSYIRDCWLRDMFDYDEPVMTNEILKGHLCEDLSLGVLSRNVPGGYRVKNLETFQDEFFVGTPDVVGDEFVEDVKSSWSLRTFVSVEKPDSLYVAQLQAYMKLTGRDRARLVHVLVDTPYELVEEEKKRFYFQFNCNESNPHYLECIKKVDAMHNAAKLIPESKRIKVFEMVRNDEYLDQLCLRVDQARVVYEQMTIGGEE